MEAIELILGLDEQAMELSAWQMASRAVLIYLLTLAIIRLGKTRLMGQATAFDMIVGIVLGSIVSRAITGNAPLLPAMAAAVAIVALHWIFSACAVRWSAIGHVLKGGSRVLVAKGAIRKDELRRAHVTRHDLEEAMRRRGMTDLAKVAEARLERDGSISVVQQEAAPRIVEMRVAPGVQTVRIELA
jgi:uncharacterized membrane protein YcaP (DUF421 family)